MIADAPDGCAWVRQSSTRGLNSRLFSPLGPWRDSTFKLLRNQRLVPGYIVETLLPHPWQGLRTSAISTEARQVKASHAISAVIPHRECVGARRREARQGEPLRIARASRG
jgi:hypothetical protein